MKSTKHKSRIRMQVLREIQSATTRTKQNEKNKQVDTRIHTYDTAKNMKVHCSRGLHRIQRICGTEYEQKKKTSQVVPTKCNFYYFMFPYAQSVLSRL